MSDELPVCFFLLYDVALLEGVVYPRQGFHRDVTQEQEFFVSGDLAARTEQALDGLPRSSYRDIYIFLLVSKMVLRF